MNSIVQSSTFINTLFEGHAEDEVVLIARNIDGNFTQLPYNERTLESWHRKGRATYVNTSTIDVKYVKPDRNGAVGFLSRKSEDTVACYMIVLDDVGTKCKEPPVAPSWKIETSPGNFQWGYLLQPTEDFDLVKRFTQALAEAGFTDGGALGHNRLVRVPGSTNVKPQHDGWRARVTEWNPDRVWDLDELIEEYGLDLPEARGSVRTSVPGLAAVEGSDPVLDWLSAEGWVVEDKGDWVDVRCPNAEAHTTGSDTAGYMPLSRGREHMRGFKCLHEHCQSWNTRRFLEWVAEQGGPMARVFDPIPSLQARFIYVREGDRICDLPRLLSDGERYDMPLAEFKNRHAYMRVAAPTPTVPNRTAPAFAVFMEDDATVRVDCYRPLPGRETGLGDDGVVNTWLPTRHSVRGSEGAAAAFMEHTSYLCGEHTDEVLDWLAYKLQNPQGRSWGLIMATNGSQGVGRSMWGKMLAGIWNARHVRFVDAGEITGQGGSAQYNDWMSGSQLVIVNEVTSGDDKRHHRSYEHIKTIVDTSPVEVLINEKYGSKRRELVYFNLLMFSNHIGALRVAAEDRRFMVLRNPDTARDIDYYQRMAGAMGGEMYAAVYNYLSLRKPETDMFRAPETDAKRDMIAATRFPGEEVTEAFVADFETPDLWTKARLLDYLERLSQDMGNGSIDMRDVNELWHRMDKLVEAKDGVRTRVQSDKPVPVRCVRNSHRWRMRLKNADKDTVSRLIREDFDKLNKLRLV